MAPDLASGEAHDALVIGPSPGMQMAALNSPADLIIFGALAGCGKTHAQFLIILQRVMLDAPGTGVLIRRLLTDITDAGGILDRLLDFLETVPPRYRPVSSRAGNKPAVVWRVTGGSFRLRLAGFKDLGTRKKFQGSPYDLILFDEADQFFLAMVEYLFSRLRRTKSDDGVVPRVYLTCNPTVAGWLYDLTRPWQTLIPGHPSSWGKIDEQSGVIRVLARRDPDDEKRSGAAYYISDVAADPRQPERFREDVRAAYTEVREKFPGRTPMSIAVIGGSRDDNPYQDWGNYDRGLSMLGQADRMALREGYWGVMPEDPRRIYRFGSQNLFELDDEEFLAALADPGLRVFRGHDYGRAEHGNAFVTGLLAPGCTVELPIGPAPALWIVETVVMTGASAEDVVLRRRQSNADLSELLGVDFEELPQIDYGDPAGEQRDARGASSSPSGSGWAASYRAMGVPLSNVSHDVNNLWWNQPEGIAASLAMVNTWLRGLRLRIADTPGTAVLREAMSSWRWDVSEEVASLIDANVAHPRPMKDVHSHPCDALRYGCGGVARWLASESHEATGPDQGARFQEESVQRLRAAMAVGRRWR